MANKKINQLVLKTTIQPTDLFPLGDATTGQLFKKTVAELQAAIGGAVISVNGLVGTVVLDTDDIAELATPTNRYFTEARARAAISLTTTGNSGASTYSNSTGVLNVPTYTLAGLGGITASFLSGGTGITYNSSTGVIAYSGTVYTDASIRALFSAGTGITYNSSTGAISYSGTVYTDSSIRGLFSLTTTGTSGAATYNNTTGVINVPNYTLAGLGGISLTALSGTAPITYNSSTGVIGITQASTSTNGFLSSTDWNTFNGKQSALTLGNVTEAVSNVLMFPDGQNGKTIGNLSIQVVQAGSTTNGFLSTTDWNTFNNKQNAITLTTTGTSGAATFSGGTLNIPQYQAALTNPVTGTGTTNYHAKWTSSSAIGNSLIYDDGAGIGIGTASPVGEGTGDIVTHIHNSASTGTARAMIRLTNGYTGSTWGNGSFITIDSAQGLYIGNQEAAPMILFTSGAARMTIASNGSISMTGGTLSDPVLAISGNTSATISGNAKRLAQFRYNTGDSTGIDIGYDATAGNGVIAGGTSSAGAGIDFWTYSGSAWGNRMTLTKAGNVGIGTSTAGTRLTISDTNGPKILLTGGSSQNGISFASHGSPGGNAPEFYLYNGNTNAAPGFSLYDVNNASWRFTITNGGNMLLGTTTDNGERLYVSGSIRATGSITANSDVRLKKNIERIENALQKVSEISGYTYNTIYDEDRHAGVIAQEIDKVLPEIVNKGNDGLMGVEYGNISALLIEAIKDLKAKNEKLEAIVEGLRK
jgi:hypothetical protein